MWVPPMTNIRVYRNVLLTSAILVSWGIGARASAQYVEVGPLDTLGQYLSQELGSAEGGSFDLALFSDCHLDRSYLPRNRDAFVAAVLFDRGHGARVWGEDMGRGYAVRRPARAPRRRVYRSRGAEECPGDGR